MISALAMRISSTSVIGNSARLLHGDDGLTLCRNLRGKSSDIPVIMLTARGEETDRILGLEMGADDFRLWATAAIMV